jgi:hypothetical protein
VSIFLLAGAGAGVAVLLSGKSTRPTGKKETAVKTEPDETDRPREKLPPRGDTSRAHLSADKQARVNRAVRRAVKYLKDRQRRRDGRWGFALGDKYARHHVALAALPGLTLLECGTARNDPAVRKAAGYVRKHAPRTTLTYDISLALLFLTRLGDKADRELIEMLALRLVAGQTGNGGWGYHCPLLGRGQVRQLTSVLRHLPRATNDDLIRTPSVAKGDSNEKLTGEQLPDRPPAADATKLVLDQPKPPPPKLVADIDKLPANLKRLPALRLRPWPKEEEQLAEESDNSNTQFAILGLWAARQRVPLDRTLALIVKRFRTSQLATGGWEYRYTYLVGVKCNRVGTATMTCAGLLGLAVGHGLAEQDIKAVPAVEDPAVQKALKALSTAVGRPPHKHSRTGQIRYNLYLLWSVERVAVLYRLQKIGGKPWYPWGVDILLKHQDDDGSWFAHGYEGSDPTIDTCLALLFLKRVNLVRDLSSKLTLEDAKTEP